ncbi:MAG: DUF2837 family protein [Bacillota bacterium]
MLICLLTGVIHMIETLSYSARLAGIRKRRLYLAGSLFSLLVLVARTANLIQAPLLGSLVDAVIIAGTTPVLVDSFRMIIFSATTGSMLAALLIPTFINIFTFLIASLERSESMGMMFIRMINTDNFFKRIYHRLERSARRPRFYHLMLLRERRIPKSLILFTIFVASINTVGVLSAIYAGALIPDYRLTASQLSGVLNGLSTIILTFFIDPYASLVTDHVMAGKRKPVELSALVACLITGKILGTILGQLMLLPCARLVSFFTLLLR